MGIEAEILGRDIPIRSFQMEYGQNEIPTFDVELPVRYIAGLDLYLEDISVLQDGQELIRGIVRTPYIIPEMQSSISAPLFTKIQCDTDLGRLQKEPSLLVHFQNELLSAALTQLLASATGSTWSLGDVSTLADREVTIDLRDKETLWSQIVAITEANKTVTFVRYGGSSGGIHLLDVGYFRTRPHYNRVIVGDNVLEAPRFQFPSQEPIKYFYPVSGKAPDEPVDLDLALNITPALANASQDYQIDEGVGRIINNRITKGVAIRRVLDVAKTENDEPPTSDELNELALSLYNTAVQEMTASEDTTSVTVKAMMDTLPDIYDACWFEGQVVEDDYDLFTEQVTQISSFALAGWFRIVGIRADYRERYERLNPFTEQVLPATVYELELVRGEKRVNKTESSEILDMTQTKGYGVYDSVEAVNPTVIIATDTVSVTRSNVAANCTFGAFDGRKFVFAIPTYPNAVAGIITITAITDGYLAQTLTYGTLGGEHEVCVRPDSGDWTTSDVATVTITILYI